MLSRPTLYLLQLGLHETYLITTSVVHATMEGGVFYNGKHFMFMNDFIRRLLQKVYE